MGAACAAGIVGAAAAAGANCATGGAVAIPLLTGIAIASRHYAAEDPRSLTEIRPIFMYQSIPSSSPLSDLFGHNTGPTLDLTHLDALIDWPETLVYEPPTPTA